ncbi:ThuA domain-containing protein [Kutzneria viridogrisea]|uniref:ThuA-like domain-containing protein n=2 Tax=Kutzneria TaxID=43356 RepID=W5W195_9PSEU|nr:ThuA domain-containing protein [Kutzneria albida]AHH94560.1 hypothetical protein KALB_1187 [Kutzneria albida DSM 43870]MBA8930229.1 hypothetical protein [Kutzneria viridogrisea]
MSRALIVRGGWPGHVPVAATELFRQGLLDAGFEITVSDTLDVYCQEELLADTDLIVQCWSQGTLTAQQCAGLTAAVHAGTGFAGWHGGVVGTFTDSRDYLRMVGGLFLHHPEEFVEYRVRVERAHADHPIVAGLPDFTITTEQYWMLTDPNNEVLASTELVESRKPATMPVVWTRRWGAGKVFFSAIGHRVADLCDPAVHALTHRGLLWASR